MLAKDDASYRLEAWWWGHLFHVVAGYGPRQVFACLVEPLIPLLKVGGAFARPANIARRTRAIGQAARALGFHPRWPEDGAEWKHAV